VLIYEAGRLQVLNDSPTNGTSMARLDCHPASTLSVMTSPVWDISPGQITTRAELGKYGGNQQQAASDDKTVRLWDWRNGRQIGEPMAGHKDGVHTVGDIGRETFDAVRAADRGDFVWACME
jgi:WD40 repeat protein